MRSRAGVGMTPPKVLGAPKPTSSVMISSTLGAPLGGTTRGGHQGFAGLDDLVSLRSLLVAPVRWATWLFMATPFLIISLPSPGDREAVPHHQQAFLATLGVPLLAR